MADSPEEEDAQYDAAVAEEYGQYVANVPIYHGGSLAYNTGHAVPASNVERHGYLGSGQVRKAGEPPPESPVYQPQPTQGEPIVIGEDESGGVADPNVETVPEASAEGNNENEGVTNG
jgi:hypothetical protein